MRKFDRMEVFVGSLGESDAELHACYTGYFTCFNRGEYYEAHDVLEHLWLRDPGANEKFFRGLIQIAGAFVHLRKQFLNPDHAVDGRRLRPGWRLFRLGVSNIQPYTPKHMRLDVEALIALCADYSLLLEQSEFRVNPWHPDRRPRIDLLPPESGGADLMQTV